jgi:hypothetical protein
MSSQKVNKCITIINTEANATEIQCMEVASVRPAAFAEGTERLLVAPTQCKMECACCYAIVVQLVSARGPGLHKLVCSRFQQQAQTKCDGQGTIHHSNTLREQCGTGPARISCHADESQC